MSPIVENLQGRVHDHLLALASLNKADEALLLPTMRARFFEAFWCWRETRELLGEQVPSVQAELQVLYQPMGIRDRVVGT